MIGKSIQNDSPENLVAYICRGEATQREGSIEIDNLVSLGTAVSEMRRLAGLAHRCAKPIWHIILAWRFDEFSTSRPEIDRQNDMLRLSREIIFELGLEAHQAVNAVHWDAKKGVVPGERHYESHVAINRIGPDGKAVSMWMDFARLEKAVAKVAMKNSKLVVPGRHNAAITGNAYDGPNREGDAARALRDRTGRASLAEFLIANRQLVDALRKCRSQKNAQAFFHALKDHGLGVRYATPKARRAKPGLVIYDLHAPARKCAFSVLDSSSEKWGQIALEKEFGADVVAMNVRGAAEPDSDRNNRAIRKNTGAYEQFVLERDAIRQSNSELRARYASSMQGAKGLLKKRRVQQRIRDRAGLLNVRRSSLQFWLLELICHEIACAFANERFFQKLGGQSSQP
jgi:Relaxase/Mobilisation nuclease domain